MRRTWILLTALGLLAVIVGGVALALSRIPPLGAQSSESGTAHPAANDDGPQEVPWAFFSQLPPDGGPGAFVIQGGVLGDDRPRVDIEVPWVVDTGLDLGRTPAVAGPAAGAIIYVADDGVASTVHRVSLRPGATPEPVGQVSDAVWSIAVAPDGSAAYLALASRGDPQDDRGVVRLSLDGSGMVDRFLEPAAAGTPSSVRLAAIAPFLVSLRIGADGRYLARTACRGPAGCETSLIDTETRAAHDLPRGTVLLDAGMGGIVLVEECGQMGCSIRAIDLETSASVVLNSPGFDTALAGVGDRVVVLGIEAEDGHGAVLMATDPRSGARRELHRVPEGQWMALGNRSYLTQVPDGAALVVEMTPEGKGMRERHLLLSIAHGGWVELPPPPIRPLPAPGLNG